MFILDYLIWNKKNMFQNVAGEHFFQKVQSVAVNPITTGSIITRDCSIRNTICCFMESLIRKIIEKKDTIVFFFKSSLKAAKTHTQNAAFFPYLFFVPKPLVMSSIPHPLTGFNFCKLIGTSLTRMQAYDPVQTYNA